METFSRFQEVLFLKENIETHILANSRNDLTFDIFRNDYKSSLSFFQNSSNKKISSNIIGQIHKHHTSFDYYLDTFRAAYGSIKHSFREDTCDIVANFSTKFCGPLAFLYIRVSHARPLPLRDLQTAADLFQLGGVLRRHVVANLHARIEGEESAGRFLCIVEYVEFVVGDDQLIVDVIIEHISVAVDRHLYIRPARIDHIRHVIEFFCRRPVPIGIVQRALCAADA